MLASTRKWVPTWRADASIRPYGHMVMCIFLQILHGRI